MLKADVWKRRIGLRICPLVAALTLMAVPAGADVVETCDRNENGQIDGTELARCLLEAKKVQFTEIDRDGDGEVTPKDVKQFTTEWIGELKVGTGHPPPYSYDELREFLRIEPERPKRGLGGVLIQKSHQNITLVEKKDPFDKAEGAVFGYSRDGVEDTTTWQVKGAVLRPWRLGRVEESRSWLSGFAVVPSLSFERVGTDGDGEDDADEPDSLTGRVGILSELFMLGPSLQTIQLTGAYATDFDFESGVVAAELTWEPSHNLRALGSYRSLGWEDSPLEWRWRVIAQSTYGSVLDAGDKENLVEDEEFLRVGPKVLIELLYEPVKATLGYEHWTGLSGEPDDVELFNGGLSMELDPQGHFTVEVLYQNGQLPLTLEDTEVFTVGLGVKY